VRDGVLARDRLERHRATGCDQAVRAVAPPRLTIVARHRGSPRHREVYAPRVGVVGDVHADARFAARRRAHDLGRALALGEIVGDVAHAAVDEGARDRELDSLARAHAHHLHAVLR
jgi:hypothetical protein